MLASNLPAVDLRNAVAGLGLPMVGTDNRAGISSGSYLSTLFHRELGLTPDQFRKRHRRL